MLEVTFLSSEKEKMGRNKNKNITTPTYVVEVVFVTRKIKCVNKENGKPRSSWVS